MNRPALFSHFTKAARAAHASLAELAVTVGDSGLAAASQSPGLLAAVDQHAASIRDGITVNGCSPTATYLAAYAEGIRDAAFKHGWRAPDVIDWTAGDWVLTRLLAVHLLARAL